MTARRTSFVAAWCALAAVSASAGCNSWSAPPQTADVAATEVASAGEVVRAATHVEPDQTDEASIDVVPKALPPIAPGTVIDDGSLPAGARLVLHATPRVAAGDVGQVSETVAGIASRFHLTILARVDRRSASPTARWKLADVELGLAADVDGKETIVSTATQESLGANLGFIERTALTQNETSVAEARQVARTPTMLVFDAKTVMRIDGEHRAGWQRHAVLVSPDDGRVSTFVWLIESNSDDGYRLASQSLVLLPPSLREDRKLHVDASEFVLGVPTQKAFALVALPPGNEVPVTAELGDLAASRFKNTSDAVRLEAALRTVAAESSPSPNATVAEQ